MQINNFDFILILGFVIFITVIIVDTYLLLSGRYKSRNTENFKVNKRVRLVKILLSTAALFSIPLIIAITYLNLSPNIVKSTPQTEGVWESYSKPLEVFFNTPVDSSRLYVNMNPEITGKWIFTPYLGINRLTNYGYFLPEETLFPEQRVVVYITGIGRIGNRSESHEHGFVFESVKPLEIQSLTPSNNEVGIELETPIIIELARDSDLSNELSFNITPQIDFTTEYPTSKRVQITPTGNLEFGTDYTIQIYRKSQRVNLTNNEILDRENPKLIFESKFTTKSEPLVNSYLPRGTSVRSDSSIKIKFANEMNRESVEENFSINPSIEGTFDWEGKILQFNPSLSLNKNTKYVVNIKNGSSDINGILLDKEFNFEFTTIGYVQIQNSTPANDEVRVPFNLQEFKVTFNQEIDYASAEERFSINPQVDGEISWDKNTLIYKFNTELLSDTTYTVSFASGIKSIYGLDSESELKSVFRTRTNEFIIQLPLYYQPQYPASFSCNIYAAKMALAWKGYYAEIPQLIAEIGNDTSRDSLGRWTANPNETYVGNADGSWGYGVHWNPVQKMFSNRGIATDLYENWNVSSLAQSIQEGKPVVIWRYNGTSVDRNLEWGTSGIYAINGQHGGVVSGFRGTTSNPTAFYINDPWFGLIWMDVNTFDYYWSRLNRVGLVVN